MQIELVNSTNKHNWRASPCPGACDQQNMFHENLPRHDAKAANL